MCTGPYDHPDSNTKFKKNIVSKSNFFRNTVWIDCKHSIKIFNECKH